MLVEKSWGPNEHLSSFAGSDFEVWTVADDALSSPAISVTFSTCLLLSSFLSTSLLEGSVIFAFSGIDCRTNKMSGGNHFFELNTGAKIPSIGLGTWNADHGLISDALTAAVLVKTLSGYSKDDIFFTSLNVFLLLKLQIGYRHIDCAGYYGNQKQVFAI